MTPALFGAVLARWEAGETPKEAGILLERAPDSDWHMAGAWEVARLKPSADYYERAAYHFTVTAPASSKVWLVIEYLDHGYGLITVSPGVAQTKQWGVARVDSQGLRRAVLESDPPLTPKRLRVQGLDYLRAVRLTDDQARTGAAGRPR